MIHIFCQTFRQILPVVVACGLVACAVDIAHAADNQPPAGFTALFNGRDLSGWKGLPKGPLDNPAKRAAAPADELAKAQKEADEDMRAHWSVADGALVFDGKGAAACVRPRITAISKCWSTGRY